MKKVNKYLLKDFILILLLFATLIALIPLKLFIQDQRTLKVPIIFIHGAGGLPEDWDEREIYNQFKNNNFDENLLLKFSYGYKNGKYDNLGDAREIANKLMKDIELLSQKSTAKGGSDKVNIITFSYGGVVADYYLKQSEADELGTVYKNNVDKVMFVGAPHNGLQLLKALDEAREIPLLATFLDRSISLVMGEETQSSSVIELIHPDSVYMRSQSDKSYPSDIHITNFYTDTYTTFSLQNREGEEVDSFTEWFGDLVVLEEDAQIYGNNVNNVKSTYEATITLPDDVINFGNMSSENLKETLPPSFHLNILSEPDKFEVSKLAWNFFNDHIN